MAGLCAGEGGLQSGMTERNGLSWGRRRGWPWVGEAGWGGGEAGSRNTPPAPLSGSEPGKVPRRMVVIGVEGKSVTAPSR